jgi:hypothetical protein
LLKIYGIISLYNIWHYKKGEEKEYETHEKKGKNTQTHKTAIFGIADACYDSVNYAEHHIRCRSRLY